MVHCKSQLKLVGHPTIFTFARPPQPFAYVRPDGFDRVSPHTRNCRRQTVFVQPSHFIKRPISDRAGLINRGWTKWKKTSSLQLRQQFELCFVKQCAARQRIQNLDRSHLFTRPKTKHCVEKESIRTT